MAGWRPGSLTDLLPCSSERSASDLTHPSEHQDRRPDKSRLRVVQYNVEFFFLDHSTGGVPCPSAYTKPPVLVDGVVGACDGLILSIDA